MTTLLILAYHSSGNGEVISCSGSAGQHIELTSHETNMLGESQRWGHVVIILDRIYLPFRAFDDL